MAKNDYFVVVYRILTYLYQCFMAGEKPDAELFGPEALGINNGYWANVMESIYNEGYITGIAMASRLGAAPGVKLLNLKITQKGIEYLQENSKMHKAAEFLKTVKEIVPGFQSLRFAFPDCPDGMVRDHINGNRLDNRKDNIRFVTARQNAQNHGKSTRNKSGCVGVTWDAERKKWLAQIQIYGKGVHLGRFSNIDDAIAVREAAEIKYFGEYRRKK